MRQQYYPILWYLVISGLFSSLTHSVSWLFSSLRVSQLPEGYVYGKMKKIRGFVVNL